MVLLNYTVILKCDEKLDLVQLWFIILVAFRINDEKFNIEGFFRLRTVVIVTRTTAYDSVMNMYKLYSIMNKLSKL